MKNSTTAWLVALLVVIVIIIYSVGHTSAPQQPSAGALAVNVSYSCDAGKTIAATYTNNDSVASAMAASSTATTTMPVPTGMVALTLGDGRTMTLPQTVSADGARYANAGETFVFWSKGNGAFVTEAGKTTYSGCIALAPAADGSNLPQAYSNSADGFSLRLPVDYKADATYKYQSLPSKTIGGVKFTIPASMTAGTNLSSDSYVSVEELPQASSCSANLFLASGAAAASMTDGTMTYSMASSTDAGAGNRYEETVYALPGTNPCIAVRYFIHYGAIENYPTDGSVKAFDKQALLNQFDAIRRTLTIAQ